MYDMSRLSLSTSSAVFGGCSWSLIEGEGKLLGVQRGVGVGSETGWHLRETTAPPLSVELQPLVHGVCRGECPDVLGLLPTPPSSVLVLPPTSLLTLSPSLLPSCTLACMEQMMAAAQARAARAMEEQTRARRLADDSRHQAVGRLSLMHCVGIHLN